MREARACVAGQPEGSSSSRHGVSEVQDDGVGFELDRADWLDETHVELAISRAKRAQTIGARLDIVSAPGKGSSVILTLPPNVHPVSSLASTVTTSIDA